MKKISILVILSAMSGCFTLTNREPVHLEVDYQALTIEVSDSLYFFDLIIVDVIRENQFSTFTDSLLELRDVKNRNGSRVNKLRLGRFFNKPYLDSIIHDTNSKNTIQLFAKVSSRDHSKPYSFHTEFNPDRKTEAIRPITEPFP